MEPKTETKNMNGMMETTNGNRPPPSRMRGARVAQVVVVVTAEGEGVDGDPVREVQTIWSLDGKLLARNDPLDADRVKRHRMGVTP